MVTAKYGYIVLLDNSIKLTSAFLPSDHTVGYAETKAGSHCLMALCKFVKWLHFGSLGNPTVDNPS